jgi:DNA-binding CsgD family transcriptional regulator/tetratricopeptide (TPR) repeat protein
METRHAGSGSDGPLRGRTDECELLDGFSADVRRGDSRSLLLRGEAGIGKTALLEYLVTSAPDMTVLRAAGVESEMELAYAGLHQLCAPLLDRSEMIPAPQRDALHVVFGMSAGPAPDRFLVGLGVLSLLSEVAEERPLLCVVDDAQWLDQASALILAFVARRLLAERVGVVFAAREPGEALQHIPSLEIRGLRNGDARALLGAAVQFMLDERVRDRIIAETRGNPLALLELPRGLTPTQLALGFGLADAHALRGQIEQSFLRRFEALPHSTRGLLLVAAAEPVGDPVLLWRAADRLGLGSGAADDAANEGLLTIGHRVTFRHPLVRSAVYGAATAEDRRGVHLALAEVTDPDLDPDRRAWHLAAAATGPDEAVAAALERSAERAQARGGAAAAAAFLKRALALTSDPGLLARRTLATADAEFLSGSFDAALTLLASAEAGPLDELGRAWVDGRRAQISLASGGGADASPLLLKAARRLEELDPGLARDTYLDAWAAAMLAGRATPTATLAEVSVAALARRRSSSAPGRLDLLLDGLAGFVVGGDAAAPRLRQAVQEFTAGQSTPAELLRWGVHAGVAASMLWDEKSWRQIVAANVRAARDAGLLFELPFGLHTLGDVAALTGDFATAASLIAEADTVAEVTGTRLARFAAALLSGLRGNEAQALAVIEAEASNAALAGHGFALQMCQWVSAVLYNGLGRYEQAVIHARRAREDSPELLAAVWVLPELIEAAVRTDETELAAEAVDRLAAATSIADSEWGAGVLARSRALASAGDEAEPLYSEAIERLSRTELRPELARAHLLYGEWLRREKRRVDARAQLRTAYEQFTAIGMEAFAERARSELAATGERVRKRTAETRDDLTGQERQIARLARDGLSNPEIGTRLFLSPRTVEWHLRKVFTKLGIRSRRELHDALAEPAAVPA